MATEEAVEPTKPSLITEDVVLNVIAELVSEAPSDDVKNCLKAYEYGKSLRQLSSSFHAFSKPVLVSTLDYLNVPNQDNYVKATNVENVICRIQNLLPDVCNMCKGVYCTKNNQSMLLSCVICGQEIHHDCLIKLLPPNTEGENITKPCNLTKEQVKALINPCNIPGMIYVCQACTTTHVPNPETGLKKRSKNVPKVAPTEDLKNKNDPLVASTAAQQTKNVDTKKGESEDKCITRKDERVCKFFLNKKCKYGIRGDGCQFAHPTLCKKLMKYGHSEKGCKKGNKCDMFHPKMCRESLNTGTCTFENCRFYHVSGTKKVEPSTPFSTVPEHHKHQNRYDQKRKSIDNDVFLDMQSQVFQSLKMELLEAMDMRLATVFSQVQNQQSYQQNMMASKWSNQVVNPMRGMENHPHVNWNVNPEYYAPLSTPILNKSVNGSQDQMKSVPGQQMFSPAPHSGLNTANQ